MRRMNHCVSLILETDFCPSTNLDSHLMLMTLDSHKKNPLFYAPVNRPKVCLMLFHSHHSLLRLNSIFLILEPGKVHGPCTFFTRRDVTRESNLNIAMLPIYFLIVRIQSGLGNIRVMLIVIATVRGVDLFPPPVTWIPPNCILEVDDILQDWTWRDPFDLIHLRQLDCAFTPEQTDRLYKQCYE